MATVRELLEGRVTSLRELMDEIQQELEGDADLARLSKLADDLGAKGDEFAATVVSAVDALQDEAEEAAAKSGGKAKSGAKKSGGKKGGS